MDMRLAPTNYVDLDYEPIGDIVPTIQLSIFSNHTSSEKCDVCQCVLTPSTGVHKMKKTKGRKIVCGMCAAQLEQKGWREYGIRALNRYGSIVSEF